MRHEFFPDRGFGRCSLSKAKEVIRSFGHVCKEPALYLDLQLYFVKCGIEFTNAYGDIDERFYSSMEGMYCDVVDTLNRLGDEALTSRFRDRLKAAVDDSENIGWGFYDELYDDYGMLE